MDGWITIGTKLDTKNFDEQILEIKRKIADNENQLSLTGKYKLSSEDIQKVKVETEKLKNKLYDLTKQKEKFNEKRT